MTTAIIPVALGGRGYDVHVGHGILAGFDWPALCGGADHALVVSQGPVSDRYGEAVATGLERAGLEVVSAQVPDGERAKSPATLAELWARAAEVPLARADVVVALGGGVVGDLAGFLAATWNRGIAVIQVPTTLLAQVDAAVGGKTGINLPEGKNLVGAFHQPAAVIADVATLATLPPRHLIAGLGEIVKYGLIADPVILDLLERDPDAARSGDPQLLTTLVERSVTVKARVVGADEREAGERAHLNFGHTFGHVVESLTGYTEVLHGEAVAIGMCMALRLGVALGRTPPDLVARTERLLVALGLPVTAPPLETDAVMVTMARDKKVAGGRPAFVVLDAIGRPTVLTPEADAVAEAIAAVTGPA